MFEIGNSLREARLRQGLDFPEIEQATKIRGKYLRALEEEQFDVLPAQTYVKGFLRSYADYLGLDGQLYVDEFNSRYVRGEFEEDQALQPRPGGEWSRRSGSLPANAVLATVAVVVGLTVFVFAAWKYGQPNEPSVYPLNHPQQTKAKPATRRVAHLVARAVNGNCYLAVYRGSRDGKPVYEGTLERGQARRFEGRRLWVYALAPANLALKLNGRPVAVPGGRTSARRWLQVTPRRVSLAPTAA